MLLFQEHKLRGTKLEHLEKRLMPWSTGWILEVEPGHKNWLNPDGAGKRGVGILLSSKYSRLVTPLGSLMNNRVVWTKMDGIEGGSLGIACVCAPNILSHGKGLWQEMADHLPKDCNWILGGDFNMIERPEDKSHDGGCTISDLEKINWNSLLDALQLHDSFKGGLKFSWDNQQQGIERQLARLD